MPEDVSAIRARLAAVLRGAEEEAPATGSLRASAIMSANRWRAEHGLPPLQDGPDRPELELHERARSLGLLR